MRITRKYVDGVLVESTINGVSQLNTNPLPHNQWPLWARSIAWLAIDADKGVGDVVYRTVGPENSEAFKAWYKKTTGKNCGCVGRQARWNQQYPLP